MENFPRSPLRHVIGLSARVLRVERLALGALMGWLWFLILLNVCTRYAGMPIYWVDEAAVYSVVWLTFIGASTMTRLRLDFAVGLMTDKLGSRAAKVAKVIATAFVLAFGLGLLTMCWIWMDPVGIARFGFDPREYAAESFNFLYTEKTQTLEWPTWVLQSIMPLFALSFSIHAAANLLEDLGWVPRATIEGFPVAHAEAVN